MENNDVSFNSFLSTLDFDELTYQFFDSVGLDNPIYSTLLYYYVY